MPIYLNDMMHCSQEGCKLKDQWYWLGKEIKNTDFQYASFYRPEIPVTDGCSYFVKSEYFE